MEDSSADSGYGKMGSMEGSSADSDYGEKLINSFQNFIGGLLLLVITVWFMFLLERAMVKFATISRRAQTACRLVRDSNVIDPDFEGRVVHVKGSSKLSGAPMANIDSETGFKADSTKGNIIKLRRVVQMYQWVEHEHTRKGESSGGSGGRRGSQGNRHTSRSPTKHSGGHDVFYTYSTEWSEVDHNDEQFHEISSRGEGGSHNKHHNPYRREPNVQSKQTDASASLGAYLLTPRQLSMMVAFEDCQLDPASVSQYAGAGPLAPTVEVTNGRSYLVYRPQNVDKSATVDRPQVGMVRIRYEAIYENGDITTVGVQRGSSFRPFTQKDAKKYDKSCLCFGGGGGSDVTVRDGAYSALRDEEAGGGGDNDDDVEEDDEDVRVSFTGGCCCIMCSVWRASFPIVQKCVSAVVGEDILLLEERHASVQVMFRDANGNAGIKVSVMRIIGMMLMWLSITLIFDPISTILGFVPLIGGFASSLFGVVTGALAVLLGSTIIGVAWVSFHPEILFTVLFGMGIVCVMCGTTTAWISTGYVLSALSAFPLTLFVQLTINERAFVNEQNALDRERDIHHHAQSNEKTGLV
jgi:hypothetical protein